jgi:hypothetical protein
MTKATPEQLALLVELYYSLVRLEESDCHIESNPTWMVSTGMLTSDPNEPDMAWTINGVAMTVDGMKFTRAFMKRVEQG